MSLTFAIVQQGLQADEPDYGTLAQQWGSEALPHLETLARLPDPAIAPRAIYLAGTISGPIGARIVREAAANADPRWKTAAAAAALGLADADASAVVRVLLSDSDASVRRIALQTIPAHPSRRLLLRLTHVASSDPEPTLRNLAQDTLSRQSPR